LEWCALTTTARATRTIASTGIGTLVEDPLAWTLEQFEKGKLPAMIERAGYPEPWRRISDVEKIASVLPAMKKQALDYVGAGRRLTGHPGCRWSRLRTSGR